MVSDGMVGESLRLFFAEHFLVGAVLFRDWVSVGYWFFWVDGNSPDQVGVLVEGPWDISGARYEVGSFGIWGFEDDGELVVVNPALFPVNPGLHTGKPGVA